MTVIVLLGLRCVVTTLEKISVYSTSSVVAVAAVVAAAVAAAVAVTVVVAAAILTRRIR